MNVEFAAYTLLISPSDVIMRDIHYFKNQLGNQIGIYPSISSPAHLTLAGFVMPVKREEALIRSLEVAAAEESAITFTVNGFCAYETSRTIFMHVEEREKFARISRNLVRKSFIALLPSEYRETTTTPHVTIGRILKNRFEHAYQYFYHQEYFRSFTATKALLFRQDDIYEKYKLIQEFPFLSRPTAQLSLFESND